MKDCENGHSSHFQAKPTKRFNVTFQNGYKLFSKLARMYHNNK